MNLWKNSASRKSKPTQLAPSTNLKILLHMQTRIFFRIVALTLTIFLVTACSKEAKKTRLLGEADSYFKAGNYDKAKLTYLNAIRLDPQNALAFERFGEMWLKDWAPLRAGPFLAKASELEPKNVQYRLRLASCYLAAEQFAAATKEALKVLELTSDSGDALIILSEAARTKEDIEAAAEQLDKFPRKNDASFNLASANLFLNTGNFIGAANALRQALTIDPKLSAVHMTMGDLYVLQKDPKQAGEEYRKAAEIAPVRSIERLKYAAFKSANGETDEVKRVATEMTNEAPDYLP